MINYELKRCGGSAASVEELSRNLKAILLVPFTVYRFDPEGMVVAIRQGEYGVCMIVTI